MTELNVKPVTEIHWADGGSPYTSTDPGGAKKDAGYNPGTGAGDGEIPTAEHFNWLLREYAEHVNWLSSFIPREFEEISDAVAAGLAHPESFRYVKSTAASQPFVSNYSIQGAGGAVAVTLACTDGSRLYYVQGTRLHAASVDDPGTELWHYDATTAFSALACDGRYVYVGDTGVNGIRLLSPSDGSTYATWNDHAGTTPVAIVACGRWSALIDTGDTDVVHAYGLTSGGVKTYLGSYDHTAAIGAFCVQGNQLYLAGAVGTDTFYIRRLALPGLTADWELDPGWSSTPTFQVMSCDGKLLYTGNDREETSAGVFGTVHAFNCLDGSLQWSCDLGAGSAINSLSHDHQYTLALDSSGPTSYVIDKTTGMLVRSISAVLAILDGIRAYGIATNNLLRYWLDRRDVLFQMDVTYDQYRPMGWMVATPLR